MWRTTHRFWRRISIAIVLTTLSAALAATSAPAAAQTPPTCASASSDSDGDGYGWENNATCLVAEQAPTPPTCESAASDSDGDGYGWENNATCLVAVKAAAATSGVESLSAPQNLQLIAHLGNSRLAVGWEAVDGADGYVLYVDGEAAARTTSTSAYAGHGVGVYTVKAHANNKTVWSVGSNAINPREDFLAQNSGTTGSCPTDWPGDTGTCRFDFADAGSISGSFRHPSLPLFNKGDVTAESDRDNGGFRTRCVVSHFSYSDALVRFGETNQNHAHLHMFFGNTTTGANSTNGGTSGTGDHLLNEDARSTCGDLGEHNKSAYWIPALLNEDGVPVVPHQINAYYKTLSDDKKPLYQDTDNDGVPQILEGMRPIPNDLQMISDNGKLKIVERNDGTFLILTIEFQNCIRVDGAGRAIRTGSFEQQADSQHQSNYTMTKHYNRGDNGLCGIDDDEYVRIPGLEFNIQWRVEEGGVNKLDQGGWTFSNGVGWDQLPEGTSATEAWNSSLSPVAIINGNPHRLHGDYMAAWEGNNSWNTETGVFTDRTNDQTSDAMSQLLDQNQRLGSSEFQMVGAPLDEGRLFVAEFGRLAQISLDDDNKDDNAEEQDVKLSLTGGTNSGPPIVERLRLLNDSAVPCSIGGGAAPNCTHRPG